MAIIYAKTADGQNEIETRARRVPPRLRSALILVDGKRNHDDLGKLIQTPDETLKALLDAGLIQVVAQSPGQAPSVEPTPAAAAPAQAKAAPPQADFAIRRRDAVRAVNDLLGPSAEALALKIEGAKDPEQLREALERAVAYIANARGGGPAAQFAARFLPSSP